MHDLRISRHNLSNGRGTEQESYRGGKQGDLVSGDSHVPQGEVPNHETQG